MTHMIVMSWSSATHNGVITCDAFFATNTETVLFVFNHSEYSSYSFIGVYDYWENQILNTKMHVNESYYALT
jgi:hypothetical protein